MSKYFAKYLPVEGEIKECDKVRHNGKIVTALKKEGEGDTWKTDGFPIYGSNLQKIKLFLCSRDIQVGDKVINPESLQEVEFRIADKTHLNGIYTGCLIIEYPAGTYNPGILYKKIGEISPEATWVKEGDEFDEEEIQYRTYLYAYDGPDTDELTFFDSKHKDYDHEIGILCPATHKHFH